MPTVLPVSDSNQLKHRLDLLAITAILSVTTLSIGGWFTSLGMGIWYKELNVPAWQPPGWVFGPVWFVLMSLVAIGAWLVLKQGARSTPFARLVKLACVFYVAQLVLNMTWSLLFFTLHSPMAALFGIILLDIVLIGMAIAFYRVSPVAGWLQLPYVVWLLFATAINTWIVFNN